MAPVRNLQGLKFGKLTVVELAPVIPGSSRNARWRCLCECGNETIVRGNHLRFNNTVSCGCHRRNRLGLAKKTHGHSVGGKMSKTYSTWCDMHARCRNPNEDSYRWYGGKGISVCDRWNDFSLFLEDMGEKPFGMSIDRIDSKKNYDPSNCRWATFKDQANNTSRNRVLVYQGRSMNLGQWAVETGLSRHTIATRIQRGWSIDRALGTPVKA